MTSLEPWPVELATSEISRSVKGGRHRSSEVEVGVLQKEGKDLKYSRHSVTSPLVTRAQSYQQKNSQNSDNFLRFSNCVPIKIF